MSFEEQERVMFGLLFDQQLREDFCRRGVSVLRQFDLSGEEIQAFGNLHPEALDFDARLRVDLILGQLCRVYPLSFALYSSLDDGLQALKQWVDVEFMAYAPGERTAVYGMRLREALPESARIERAIVELELGMQWTAASLRNRLAESRHDVSSLMDLKETPVQTEGWLSKKISLADFVTASVIPQSYTDLLQAFQVGDTGDLWRRLQKTPPATQQLTAISGMQQPRLLVTRAVLVRDSLTDPVIEHNTVELSDGFAQLLPHVNGQSSVSDMLQQLQDIGAGSDVLQGVSNGFSQLVEQGMILLS